MVNLKSLSKNVRPLQKCISYFGALRARGVSLASTPLTIEGTPKMCGPMFLDIHSYNIRVVFMGVSRRSQTRGPSESLI